MDRLWRSVRCARMTGRSSLCQGGVPVQGLVKWWARSLQTVWMSVNVCDGDGGDGACGMCDGWNGVCDGVDGEGSMMAASGWGARTG